MPVTPADLIFYLIRAGNAVIRQFYVMILTLIQRVEQV
ncbi:hypothetical protein X965_00475 [Morganella sp. EGD-HP17]|nr:hypothetical protein X965_00475 [Morganella sp. EGD-HP17]